MLSEELVQHGNFLDNQHHRESTILITPCPQSDGRSSASGSGSSSWLSVVGFRCLGDRVVRVLVHARSTPLQVLGGMQAWPVSMGNPHRVIFGETVLAAEIGPSLCRDENANIEFALRTGPQRYDVGVYERGAGLTRLAAPAPARWRRRRWRGERRCATRTSSSGSPAAS